MHTTVRQTQRHVWNGERIKIYCRKSCIQLKFSHEHELEMVELHAASVLCAIAAGNGVCVLAER